MKIFFNFYRKRPLFPILISLLLLLAISLTVIGFAMLQVAQKQRTEITDKYVTIAVNPDYIEYDSWEEEYGAEESFNLSSAYAAAMNSGFVQAVDHRYILGAEVNGSKAILSCYNDLVDYNARFDNPCYNMAVFAVKCIKCEKSTLISQDDQNEGEVGLFLDHPNMYYQAEFEIVEVISLAESYPDIYDSTSLLSSHYHDGTLHFDPATVPVPATIEITDNLFKADGEVPFQDGHTYLVYGFYYDYPADTIKMPTEVVQGRMLSQGRHIKFIDESRQTRLDMEITVSEQGEMEDFAKRFAETIDEALQVKRGYMSDGGSYYYPNEEMLPRWVEYNDSWEDFLASDEGRTWREEIIPLCKVNQSSATVILSDSVQSMYVFNTGIAGLLNGRFFNAADYNNGSNVCMISAAYAQHNGYKLGDKLTLDFYDTGFSRQNTIPRGPCLPENRMDITAEYEIVGIYSAPEFSRGEQLFCADTILIPKKSIAGSESFKTTPGNRLVTSLILKNGTKESFLSYMEQEGYKDAYICFDQNFGAAEVSIDALVKNGRMLLWIGIAAFIITAALAHFLTMRRFAPSAKTMRILGIGRKVVAKQAFGAFILIDAVAALLGAGLAAALFSTVTEKAVSTALAPDYPVIAACAAAAFLLLAMISLLCAKALSNVPLLQTEKKGLK